MEDLITCATCGHDKSWHEEGRCTAHGCECAGFRSGDIADEEGDVEVPATPNDLRDPDDGSIMDADALEEGAKLGFEPGGGDSGGAGASGDV